jgi:hypothetical protein
MPNYTYDDFISYLPSAGLTEADFSAQDMALARSNPTAGVMLMEAKSDWKNAKTDDERALANARANQVRSQYGGYSGGIDGANGNVSLTPDDMPGQAAQTSFAPQTAAPQAYGQAPVYSFNQQAPVYSFNQQAPAYQAPAPYVNQYQGQQQQLLGGMMNYPQFQYQPYQNQYSEQQQQLLNDMLNYEKFNFDPETSPLYSSYKKQYSREGNRAMQDTLGSMAAATGGMPSTAAMSAASQANDYYMAQLGDRLPQIYQQEYNKYLQDFGMIGQKLGAVNDMEGVDYSRYWDGKNFDYGKYLDDYSRMQGNLGAVNELAAQDRGVYESDRNYGLNLYGQQRGDYEADRNYALGEYNVRRGDYESDRNFDYGRQLDEMERARLAEQTAYNRSRDALSDEQLLGETERRSRLDSDARMMDMWKAQGRASPEVAAYFGVPAGTYYGGEESELALAQARANIEQTNKETAYIGTSTGKKGGTAPISDAQINAAYERVRAGNGAGADIALLKDAGWTAAELQAMAGGTDGNAIDAALDRLYSGTGTQNDIQTLIDAGYDTNDLKDEFPDMFGSPNADAVTATDWRDAYDEASLKEVSRLTGIPLEEITEEKIDQLISSGRFTSYPKNGKIVVKMNTRDIPMPR